MPLFYHYTDDAGAQNIIRTGKILASLNFMAAGDAAFGNGVYLNKLTPETTTKSDIARNNWMNTGAQFIKKTENYFVFDIPESDVEDTKARNRNIFVLGNKSDLRLQKYPWWLKNFDSNQIIASYKYQLTSLGPASSVYQSKMGDYVITDDTANGKPVYKHSSGSCLFMDSFGSWSVGPVAGKDEGCLQQCDSNNSLGPDLNMPWIYGKKDAQNLPKWFKDDSTLKAYAWQK